MNNFNEDHFGQIIEIGDTLLRFYIQFKSIDKEEVKVVGFTDNGIKVIREGNETPTIIRKSDYCIKLNDIYKSLPHLAI